MSVSSDTHKGVRGFELDIHVNFARPLPQAEALAALLVLEGFTVELYRPHPKATSREVAAEVPDLVPSARLLGPLRDPELVRAGLRALLGNSARSLEVGLRGFLRSSTGQTEWMPWRRVQVLGRSQLEQVAFAEGVRYALE